MAASRTYKQKSPMRMYQRLQVDLFFEIMTKSNKDNNFLRKVICVWNGMWIIAVGKHARFLMSATKGNGEQDFEHDSSRVPNAARYKFDVDRQRMPKRVIP